MRLRMELDASKREAEVARLAFQAQVGYFAFFSLSDYSTNLRLQSSAQNRVSNAWAMGLCLDRGRADDDWTHPRRYSSQSVS